MHYMAVSALVLRAHIDYTAWASLRILRAASALTPQELTHDFHTADRSVLGTLAHLFASDRLWLARLSGAPRAGFITDADRDIGVLQTAWPELLEGWQTWASDLTDERAIAPVAFIDLKGASLNQPLWQLIFHVVNHGTHHRGQVSGFLRSLGHPPPPTDLADFYREEASSVQHSRV
jgi:uncharacterized damage-inducible protein DinB